MEPVGERGRYQGKKETKGEKVPSFIHPLREMNPLRGAGVDNYVKGSREVKKYSSAARKAVLLREQIQRNRKGCDLARGLRW